MNEQKTKILLSLHYLPNTQYFSKFLLFGEVILEQYENYQKGSFRNRTQIASANGSLRLSIPLVKGKNEQQSIRAVKIAYHENWQAQHWQAIRSAYGNAPFFEFYADGLYPFYHHQYEFLFDFNFKLLEFFLLQIGIKTPIKFSDAYNKVILEEIADFRGKISPKINFLEMDSTFKPIKYAQVFEEKHGFLPNLSILDALFCMGPGAIMHLQQSININ